MIFINTQKIQKFKITISAIPINAPELYFALPQGTAQVK